MAVGLNILYFINQFTLQHKGNMYIWQLYPLYNFIAIKDISKIMYKEHHQLMNINSTNILFEFCPFVIFSIEIMFALSLKTGEDMFSNFGTSINHHQTVCKEQEPCLYLHFSRNYAPLYF